MEQKFLHFCLKGVEGGREILICCYVLASKMLDDFAVPDIDVVAGAESHIRMKRLQANQRTILMLLDWDVYNGVVQDCEWNVCALRASAAEVKRSGAIVRSLFDSDLLGKTLSGASTSTT